MFDEDKFFSAYDKKKKENLGIPNIPMNAPYGKQSRYSGQLGLELEIEGRALPNEGHLEHIIGKTTKALWSSHTDGSLRGENFEYVLTKPIMADEVRPMVTELYEVFKARSSTLDCSNRCSTHVHVNMRGKKINELTSIMAAWMVFENALIRWNGIERVTNHFCLSSSDSASVVQAWTALLRSGNSRWPDGIKYSALNILTLNSFGSFEFRCGQSPTDPEKVIKWALFLSAFSDYVTRQYQNPNDIAYDLSERGAIEIFNAICSTNEELKSFREEVLSIYDGDIENFNNSCMAGFRNAQPFVLGFPWDEWLPLINREFVPDPFDNKKKERLWYGEALAQPPEPEPLRARPAGLVEMLDREMDARRSRRFDGQAADIERQEATGLYWSNDPSMTRPPPFPDQQARKTIHNVRFSWSVREQRWFSRRRPEINDDF